MKFAAFITLVLALSCTPDVTRSGQAISGKRVVWGQPLTLLSSTNRDTGFQVRSLFEHGDTYTLFYEKSYSDRNSSTEHHCLNIRDEQDRPVVSNDVVMLKGEPDYYIGKDNNDNFHLSFFLGEKIKIANDVPTYITADIIERPATTHIMAFDEHNNPYIVYQKCIDVDYRHRGLYSLMIETVSGNGEWSKVVEYPLLIYGNSITPSAFYVENETIYLATEEKTASDGIERRRFLRIFKKGALSSSLELTEGWEHKFVKHGDLLLLFWKSHSVWCAAVQDGRLKDPKQISQEEDVPWAGLAITRTPDCIVCVWTGGSSGDFLYCALSDGKSWSKPRKIDKVSGSYPYLASNKNKVVLIYHRESFPLSEVTAVTGLVGVQDMPPQREDP